MQKVIFYTVHKAASNFIHTLLSDLASLCGVNHCSINDDAYYDEIVANGWNHIIEAPGHKGIFGPVRSGEGNPSIPLNNPEYTYLVHLRDPRDALTSLYFSMTYSFPMNEDGFPSKSLRNYWELHGIDEFVLERARECRRRYSYLIDNLKGLDNAVFLNYETMVADYGRWLRRVMKSHKFFFNSKARYESAFNCLYNKYADEFRVEKEDIYNHKRQILPGDYMRKLKPDTILSLNEEFKDMIEL